MTLILPRPTPRYDALDQERLRSALEQEDRLNLKRNADQDLPHALTVRGRNVSPFVTFAADDATPSVALGTNFKTANANPTTVTAFDDGVDGQEIWVLIQDANTTIDFTGTTIKGNAGVDRAMANGDALRCVFDGTNWTCDVIDATA